MLQSISDFPINDTVGAWVPHGKFIIAGRVEGHLQGLRFAAKDLFDVAGYPTGAGNPTWLETHTIPEFSSPLVDQLLDNGATLVGKVVTDELAYSLNGDNIHYGTPHNSAAPKRVTGGSSSGSAAAVAAKLVDFALGTDTGGSTRIPASYCGLWGLRTTHGALSMRGSVPLHPSYDTATWLAHDAETFERVGDTLLPASPSLEWTRVLVPQDLWALADGIFQPWLQACTAALQSRPRLSAVKHLLICPTDIEQWRMAYVTSGAYEGWQAHGEWIKAHTPVFSAPIAERWKAASRVTQQAGKEACEQVQRIRQHVHALVANGGVMVLPSAAGLAPLRDAPADQVDDLRMRSMRITCVAGLCGLPQVSIPFWATDPISGEQVPLGISLLAAAGSDRALIHLARQIKDSIQTQ